MELIDILFIIFLVTCCIGGAMLFEVLANIDTLAIAIYLIQSGVF